MSARRRSSLEPDIVYARIEAARALYNEKAWSRHKRLEDGVAGRYPVVVPGSVGTKVANDFYDMLAVEQINLNMLLWLSDYHLSNTYDQFPTITFADTHDVDPAPLGKAERLIQAVMDEGDFMAAARVAMRSCFTRGVWAVVLEFGEGMPSAEKSASSRVQAGALAVQAMMGADVHPMDGVDNEALGEACRALMNDETSRVTMTEGAYSRLMALASEADVALEKELDAIHRVFGKRGSISYRPVKLGHELVWDNAVTDRSMRRWEAYRKVLSWDEFQADPIFTDESKKYVEPMARERAEGYVNVKFDSMDPLQDQVENGAVTVWEYWDKQKWERHYVISGLKDFAEKDAEYPYLNEHGRPIFDDYFPSVIVTPVEHGREEPQRTYGMPLLEPCWPIQIEIIRTATAYIQACKRSARIGWIDPDVSDDEANAVREGRDGTFIRPGANWDRSKSGDPVSMLAIGQAPVDYLQALQLLIAQIATHGRVALSSMTSKPSAATLGQEELAVRGAGLLQSDLVGQFEWGCAEVARKTAAMIAAYYGPETLVQYSRKTSPEELKAILLALQGSKIEARFASGTRTENAVRNKQLMDWIAVLNTIRNPITGLPEFDVKPVIERAAKSMDMPEPVPYVPSARDMAMMMAMGQQNPTTSGGASGEGTSNREAPGGGREDGRAAGGRRGPPSVPNRQGRGQNTGSNMTGMEMRGKTATS